MFSTNETFFWRSETSQSFCGLKFQIRNVWRELGIWLWAVGLATPDIAMDFKIWTFLDAAKDKVVVLDRTNYVWFSTFQGYLWTIFRQGEENVQYYELCMVWTWLDLLWSRNGHYVYSLFIAGCLWNCSMHWTIS